MGAELRLWPPIGGCFGGFVRFGEPTASYLGNLRRNESTTSRETDLQGS